MKEYHGHKFKNGVFVTPLNMIENLKKTNWHRDSAPDYLWLACIIEYYGRDNGLIKCKEILSYIKNNLNTKIDNVMYTSIRKLGLQDKISLFSYILTVIDKDALDPLCIFNDGLSDSAFNQFFNVFGTFDNRIKFINELMTKLYDFHDNLSTDINYLVLYYSAIFGKLKICNGMLLAEAMKNYCNLSHEDEIMRTYRPSIRATAQSLNALNFDNAYSKEFWEIYKKMNDCKCYMKKYDSNNIEKEFIEQFANVIIYYNDYLMNVNPLDQKALVLFGILNYSYKLLIEISTGDADTSIISRIVHRIILENYIITKYLLLEEKNHSNIWNEYQSYGAGKLKMLIERHKDFNDDMFKHIDYEYLGLLMSDGYNEAFLDMDTKYFDNKKIREKFEMVDEKALYNAYDYDSLFEHSLWGEIRETVLMKCTEPSHDYHWVLDTENVQNLSSISEDIKNVLLRQLCVVEEAYGLPEELKIIYEFKTK